MPSKVTLLQRPWRYRYEEGKENGEHAGVMSATEAEGKEEEDEAEAKEEECEEEPEDDISPLLSLIRRTLRLGLVHGQWPSSLICRTRYLVLVDISAKYCLRIPT